MMVRAILAYQRAVEGRPSPCRFFPSCSEYGREAISVHGARRGSWLTVRRLIRCRPFGPSGYDPVPLPSCSAPDCHGRIVNGMVIAVGHGRDTSHVPTFEEC